MKQYKEVNGTSYNTETPNQLIEVLEAARKNQTRVVIDYGNTTTKQSWNETFDTIGYISRSTGQIKIPILIHNIRSTGGGSILDNCILSVKESKGKKVLYQL